MTSYKKKSTSKNNSYKNGDCVEVGGLKGTYKKVSGLHYVYFPSVGKSKSFPISRIKRTKCYNSYSSGKKFAKKTSYKKKSPAKKTSYKKKSPAKKTSYKKKSPAKKTSYKKKSPAKKTSYKKKSPVKKLLQKKSKTKELKLKLSVKDMKKIDDSPKFFHAKQIVAPKKNKYYPAVKKNGKKTYDDSASETIHEELFVDLCRVLKTFEGTDLGKLSANKMSKTFRNIKTANRVKVTSLFNAETDVGKDYGSLTTSYNLEPQDLFIKAQKPLAQGASGKIYKGYFGAGPGTMQKAIIKENISGTPKGDAMELLIQAFLFCDFRGMTYINEAGMKGAAKIPKPLFAANYNNKTRYLGMQTLDQDCGKYLMFQKGETSDQHWNRFSQVAKSVILCLQYLQKHFGFVHGDLHLGNVMVTLVPFKVYIIDFGRSALNMWGKRQYVDDSDFKWPESPSVDLLIFYTAVSDMLEDEGKTNCKTYKFCKREIDKVYDKILSPSDISKVSKPYKPFREYYDESDEGSDWWMLVLADKLFDIKENNLIPETALEFLQKF